MSLLNKFHKNITHLFSNIHFMGSQLFTLFDENCFKKSTTRRYMTKYTK